MNQAANGKSMLESRLVELQEENELLWRQLHDVQEELDRHFLKNQAIENPRGTKAQTVAWVDDEWLASVAEVQRLRTIVEVQSRVGELLERTSLNVQLGKILIQGVESPGTLLGVPWKLFQAWRQENRKTPPEVLGGASLEKVIQCYGEGGFDAVTSLLSSVSISAAIQGNAYTALARHLMKDNVAGAAEAARRAHAADPRPYRLKWLAFRLHDAGQVIEADALLDLLPQDVKFSSSEARQVNDIRREAKQARLQEARRSTDFLERRGKVERTLKALEEDRDFHRRLAAERQLEIEAAKEAKSTAESEWGREVETLQAAHAQLAGQKSALARRHDEVAVLAASRAQEIEALQRENAELKQKKAALAGRHEEQKRTLQDCQGQIEGLTRIKEALEQEKGAMLSQAQEQRQENELLLAQLHQVQEELERCFNQNAELKQEKSALAGRLDEQAELVVARSREVEALQAAQVQLEADKAVLAGRLDEQSQLAAERLKQLSDLQQQMQSRKAAESELNTRQQGLQEELVKAEAQLDLIKDLFLRETGL